MNSGLLTLLGRKLACSRQLLDDCRLAASAMGLLWSTGPAEAAASTAQPHSAAPAVAAADALRRLAEVALREVDELDNAAAEADSDGEYEDDDSEDSQSNMDDAPWQGDEAFYGMNR